MQYYDAGLHCHIITCFSSLASVSVFCQAVSSQNYVSLMFPFAAALFAALLCMNEAVIPTCRLSSGFFYLQVVVTLQKWRGAMRHPGILVELYGRQGLPCSTNCSTPLPVLTLP